MRMFRNQRAIAMFSGLLFATSILGACGGNVATTGSGSVVSSSTTSSTATSTVDTNGTATLSWSAPTTNTDGTPITNLAGYRVYYGTSSDALTETIVVAGSTTTSFEVTGLSPGTYYFAVTALSSDGLESALSETATKTI